MTARSTAPAALLNDESGARTLFDQAVVNGHIDVRSIHHHVGAGIVEGEAHA